MVKILHTGDLHLDSPMSSLELGAAEAARDGHRKVFAKMMQYAIDEKIDMILICGDLFDGKYITPCTKELVIKYFSEFKKPIIIAPGNHDPYSAISIYRNGALPENVYVYSSEELQVFDFDELGVSVYGYAFLSPSLRHSPLSAFPAMTYRNGDNKRILCAHAELQATSSNYAPITVGEIEQYGFSYAALGHIHNPPKINSDKTLINYCGFLFGRSYDELGDGGAFVVTINENKTSADRIVFSEQRFARDELDVSGARDTKDIEAKISEFITKKGYGTNTSLRLSLLGTLPLELHVDQKALERFPHGLAELNVKDITTPMPDGEYLENDPSLRGELYRTLLPKLRSDDAEGRKCALEALRLALCAIDGINLSNVIGTDEEDLI